MVIEAKVELDSTGSNVEEFLGDTEVPELVPVQEEIVEAPEPFSIRKVILTPEMLNTARELFPSAKTKAIDEGDVNFPKDAGGFLAQDLVDTMRVDFADRVEADPNFLTYEALRNGTAGILDLIPAYANLPAKSRMLSDDDIAKIFSNAEDAPIARAFFGEFAKTLPALQAGMTATAVTGSKLFSKPIVKTPSPLMGAEYLGKTAVALGTGVAAGLAAYSLADAIEEGFLGPDPVVVDGQRAAYEAWRTAGGGAANIFFPFMLARYKIDSGARFVLDNLGNNIKGPLGLRIQAGLDELLSGTATVATSGRAGAISTGLVETGGAAGSSVGAYLAESGESGTGGRLLAEFIGGNVGALTVLKAIPKALTSVTEAGGVEGITATIGDKRQRKVFAKISDYYEKFGDEKQFDTLMDNLNSPEFIEELQSAFPNVEFSIAQQTADPLFMALEASRSGSSEKLTAARMKSTKQAFIATSNFIKALTAEGSESSLNAAAELRKSLFEETVENNIAVPLNNLLNAARRLRTLPVVDGEAVQGVSSAELSKKLTEVLDNQIFKLMAAKERKLYKAAGARDHVIYDLSEGTPDFVNAFDEVSYAEKAVQDEFQKAAPEIFKFINQVKKDLGVSPDIDPEDLARIKVLETEVESFRGNKSNALFRDVNEKLNRLKERFIQENMTVNQQKTAVQDMAEELFAESVGNPFPDQIAQLKQAARGLESEVKLIALKDEIGFIEPSIDDGPIVITANRVDEIRSRALALAREYTNGLNPSKSDFGRRLGQFANSLREGLDSAATGAPEAYKNALAFTKAKHDVVSRMVNAKAAGTKASGERAVDPLIQFSTYITANPSVSLGRTRQLQALAKFADDQSLVDYAAEEGVKIGKDPVFTTINNLTDAYLRQTQIEKVITNKFDATLNKVVPVVNAQKLDEWREANKDLLEAFPQLDKDTADAVTFQRSLEFKQARKKRLDKKALVQQQLGSLLRGRSPTEAVGEAFEAKYPAEALKDLFGLKNKVATLAESGRPKVTPFTEVIGTPLAGERPTQRTFNIAKAGLNIDDINEGFRTAILQQALMRAGGEVGGANKTFDPKTFHEFIFKPVGPSEKVSLGDLALKNGIFTEGQFKRLKFMSTQLVRLQAADAAGKLNDPNFADEAGALVDFYYSVVGSALGSAAYSATSSVLPTGSQAGQLAASSAGAKYIRTIMQSIPALQNLDTLDEALMDAGLVSKLLRRPSNPKNAERERFAVGNYLKSMFFERGVEMAPFVARETFEEDDNTLDAPYLGFPGIPENAERNRQQYIDRIQRNLPRNDQGASLARPPTNQALAVPLSSPQPVNSAPVNRERYAALFPNDPISNMITQAQPPARQMARGGIASLMR